MRNEVLERLGDLGFTEADAHTLAEHFLDAEARGKRGHGLSRVEWLGTLPDLDPRARPERLVQEPAYERWDGNGAVGDLTLPAGGGGPPPPPPPPGPPPGGPPRLSPGKVRASGGRP